jgi:hypothetical protein
VRGANTRVMAAIAAGRLTAGAATGLLLDSALLVCGAASADAGVRLIGDRRAR